jgi:probable phosphoglycerate mutase
MNSPDAGSTCVYLVRHGETAWSLSGQHTGATDIALTAHGVQQARALAPQLRDIAFAHVLTSPAERARHTCGLAGFAQAAVCVPDLREWDYGAYEGLRSADVRKTRPGWSVWRDGCPGGDSVEDILARADRVIAALRAMAGPVLVFSHGQFGSCLGARWIGLTIGQAQHLQMDPAAISVLGFSPTHPETPVIARWNVPPSPETRDA